MLYRRAELGLKGLKGPGVKNVVPEVSGQLEDFFSLSRLRMLNVFYARSK